MTDWPEFDAKVLREGVIQDEDNPDEVISLFQSDRVAVVVSTWVNGRKAAAVKVLDPGVHRRFENDADLIARFESSLRAKLQELFDASRS